MAAKTLYLATALLNHTARGIVYTPPSQLYLGLFTTAPTFTGGGVEVSGGSYARQAVTFGVPDNSGVSANNGSITFPTATGVWGTVVAVAYFDSLSGGNMLYQGVVSTSKTVGIGDTANFAVGALTIGES